MSDDVYFLDQIFTDILLSFLLIGVKNTLTTTPIATTYLNDDVIILGGAQILLTNILCKN